MNIIEIFSVLSVLSVVLWVLQREHTVLVVFFKICFIQSIFILGDPNSNWYTFVNWTILYKGLVYTGNCFFLGFFNYPKYNKPTLLALIYPERICWIGLSKVFRIFQKNIVLAPRYLAGQMTPPPSWFTLWIFFFFPQKVIKAILAEKITKCN